MPRKKRKVYAVAAGRNIGIYSTWEEAKKQVDGFKKARHKSFPSTQQGILQAQTYLSNQSTSQTTTTQPPSISQPSMYQPSLSQQTTTTTTQPISQQTRKRKRTTYQTQIQQEFSKPTQSSTSTSSCSSTVTIWTDGATSNNGSKNAKGGIGIFFDNGNWYSLIGEHQPPQSISERFDIQNVTNQRCELYAIFRTLVELDQRLEKRPPAPELECATPKRVVIMTDSDYSLKCLTKWHHYWKKKSTGWTKANGDPVKNVDIIQPTLEGLNKFHNTHDVHVHIEWCKAHNNIPGNVEADRLAVQGKDFKSSTNFLQYFASSSRGAAQKRQKN